jgi:acyl-CoA reductase-like NAD-dependent aldehyde dehydrogenase
VTDHPFDLEGDARVVALERAISAAENAAQTVACLWEMLTPAERDRWLAHAREVTPRRDVALKTLMPAADKLLAEMRAADS